MRTLAVALSLSLAALAGGAHADPSAVTVSIGPGLQSRSAEFGDREIAQLRDELRDEVGHALGRKASAPVRADLVIEDATPNRPTFAQLGRSPGLSLRSIGTGGARVSGTVTFANGATQPVRFQWYESSLRDDRGASTWMDAERSFSYLASDLADGRVPDAYKGQGPSRDSGHFGYPYHY